MKTTTISIKESTKKRIREYGLFGETFDDVLNSIMDELEKLKNAKGKSS